MKPWQRTLVGGAAEVGGLLAAHRLLIVHMAHHDVASAIFAAGAHVPRLTLLTAGLFLLVRCLAVLALPGLILARLGEVILAAVTARRACVTAPDR